MIAADYEYRVDTDVVTTVTISGGQSDPDHPVSVTFSILGRNYTVNNVYYPEDGQQLVWVKWHTPSTEQYITINVSVSGGGSASKGTITANIVDLDRNPPPNPVADDRNDSYNAGNAIIPANPQKTSASWSVWRPWWKEKWVWHSDWKWKQAPIRKSVRKTVKTVMDIGKMKESTWTKAGGSLAWTDIRHPYQQQWTLLRMPNPLLQQLPLSRVAMV